MPNWIVENLEKLLPVLIAALYFFSSMRGKKEPPPEEDPEAQERARRIQEEIRRKIMERQGKVAPSSPSSDADDRTLVGDEEFPTVPTAESRPTPTWRPDPDEREPVDLPSYEDPYAEQRRALAEKQRRARELQAKVRAQSALPKTVTVEHDPYALVQARNRIQKELQEQSSLRKAIILKEILDKPVGLR